jgi:serine/threonine-protein kinase
MSPEQIAGKKVDGRSDLYSLGVMLFQMLTGVLPFRGDSMAELMYKIASEEAPDVRIIRAELPERLASIVALALAKKPEERYQTGEQLAADLRSVVDETAGLTALGGQSAAGGAAPAGAGADLQQTVVQSAARAAGSAPGYDAAQKFETGEQQFAATNAMRTPSGPVGPAAQGQRDAKTPPGKI